MGQSLSHHHPLKTFRPSAAFDIRISPALSLVSSPSWLVLSISIFPWPTLLMCPLPSLKLFPIPPPISPSAVWPVIHVLVFDCWLELAELYDNPLGAFSE